MAIGAPWTGSTTFNTANGTTTGAVDISAAPNGQWLYVFLGLSDTQAAGVPAPEGWTSVAQVDQARTHIAWFRKWKTTADTSVTFTWATSGRYLTLPVSWPGLHATAPDEGAVGAVRASSSASFTTASSTPTGADRWAVMTVLSRSGTSANKANPTTFEAALVERADVNTSAAASGGWLNAAVADSSGPVTPTSHSYTATQQFAESNACDSLFYLIPAPNTGTPTPKSFDRASGAWVAPTARKVRIGGAWVPVTARKVRLGGAWVTT